jgi:hypothetical protein
MHNWIQNYQTNLFAALSTTRPPTSDRPLIPMLKRSPDPRETPNPDPKRRRTSRGPEQRGLEQRGPEQSPNSTEADPTSGKSDAGAADNENRRDPTSGYHLDEGDGDSDLSNDGSDQHHDYFTMGYCADEDDGDSDLWNGENDHHHDNTSGYHVGEGDGVSDLSNAESVRLGGGGGGGYYEPRNVTAEIFRILNVLPHYIETHLI